MFYFNSFSVVQETSPELIQERHGTLNTIESFCHDNNFVSIPEDSEVANVIKCHHNVLIARPCHDCYLDSPYQHTINQLSLMVVQYQNEIYNVLSLLLSLVTTLA